MSAPATSNGVESKNMRLIGHHDMGGFGNGGEGMGLQKTRDGRRILYIAHECAPINFSVVDVTDPSKPQLVTQTELPHSQVRSNSLDLVGDTLAVAYQTQQTGLQPAGVELFDVSDPGNPRSISFFEWSSPRLFVFTSASQAESTRCFETGVVTGAVRLVSTWPWL